MLPVLLLAGMIGQTGSIAVADLPPAVEIRLQPVGLVPGDGLGHAIAVDKKTLVSGARSDLSGAGGSAFVFTRRAGQWIQTQVLAPDDRVSGDDYGHSVAIDGKTLAVGARNHGGEPFSAGAVYVYRRKRGRWREEAKLVASDAELLLQFGQAIAIQGKTIVVGTLRGNRAYVFERRRGRWEETQILTASRTGEGFGNSLAIDGATLAIGAPLEGKKKFSGALYLFGRTSGQKRGAATWVETERLTAAGLRPEDLLGSGVALHGNTLAVGAPTRVDEKDGTVYVFERAGESWQETTKLAGDDILEFWDDVGYVVAIQEPYLAFSAPREGGVDSGLNGFGFVYLYEQQAGSWVRVARIGDSEPLGGGNFGRSLALTRDTVFVGASGSGEREVGGRSSGAIFAYR